MYKYTYEYRLARAVPSPPSAARSEIQFIGLKEHFQVFEQGMKIG